MEIRSRAPLRLGLGGGGTDLTAYSKLFGGCVVNATIDLFAHCTLTARPGRSRFRTQEGSDNLELLKLHHAVHKKVVSEWNHGRDIEVSVWTSSDVPPGSGLGASSAIVVAQLAAYARLLGYGASPEDLARQAYVIERLELGMSGGLQDSWASAYGGFNFLDFCQNGNVDVHPLPVSMRFYRKLQDHLLLFNTGVQRASMAVMQKQVANTESGNPHTLDCLHSLKADALFVREVLHKEDLISFASSLRRSWEAKKHLADGISNSYIEDIYETALSAGALAGKVVGAGGGGFMLFIVPPELRGKVERALCQFPGASVPVRFFPEGAHAWWVPEKEEALCSPALTL